ncbi:Cysteine-rich receptor-like protein kinase 10 [Abeliophyllum distichum]|uniref:non-specific serine/threonine protein kinase n=1 Tax=Abeliophyllum distichum TaxID=126358 RepID=A0ABD1QKS2_9LAMI
MAKANSTFFPLILIPFLVLNLVSGKYLNSSCDDNVPYELNSPFYNNLMNLFNSLSLNTPQSQGFYKTSIGNDQVYGRALCRGDVNSAVCQNCVESACQDLSKKCQTQSAVIWYDECQVEYSYGTLTTAYTGKYPESNNEKVSDPVQFCQVLTNLSTILAKMAKRDELMFATGKRKLTKNETIYGLVQCTRDISSEECGSCLYLAFTDLNGCGSSEGGMVLSRTCNLRFELKPFYSEPHTSRNKSIIRASIAATICIMTVAIALGIYFCNHRSKKTGDEEKSQIPVLQEMVAQTPNYVMIKEESNILSSQELPFMEFAVMKAATDNFLDSNKLGQGGFGTVYKGILPDGKEIAVKRLSRRSWQGLEEFKNEIRLIAKLQHRNLVRLLGCSLEGNEKLLIYEYMPNKSLDTILFDLEKRLQLDWTKRLKIISGIARGLLYLHEESRLKIIHRDLKPSNVLLDHLMAAKISDFGMARMFQENQNMANTKRVVGTYGYMAPEYAMEGLFSVKSDVFSFGVILLEIIIGKRNIGSHLNDQAQTLLTYAWRLWNEGQQLDLIDPMLTESCPMQELERCIHIGLLCVQEDPAERPTMSEVVVLLETKQISPPEPNKPAFSVRKIVRHIVIEGEFSSTKDQSVNQLTISSIAPR